MSDSIEDAPDYRGYREKGNKWLERIRAAEKREERWIKDAEAAESAYAQDEETDGKKYDFNILHSNVETIVPAIYNSTPVPDVRDRFSGGDQMAKSVSDIYERIISTQIDDNKLDTEIEAGAQDAFLAGRGIVRIRFDADVDEQEDELGEVSEVVSGEAISFEAVSWRDYREGPARRFEDVSWVAFRHMIPDEQLEEFKDGDMVAAQIKEEDPPTDGAESDIEIWEVWDKSTKMVHFIRDGDGTILKEEEDPLGLRGFFPISKPVQPIGLTGRRTPVCPFVVYRKLADELDKTTKRINAILGGLKVKGWIVGNADDVEQLADAGDNELVPISGFEGLAQTGGIDKAIVWWPIDKAIQVLRELYVARDQTKQAIYEITGISDIVRGASNAQETLGAQEIKTQWGSLRIKKMQRLIERQVRDLFVMSVEIIASRFSFETIQQISGLQIDEQMAQLIRDPLQRYRIDVESDSTVRADLSRVKGELAELLQGTAQYFSTMAPVIAQAPEAAEPVADIYAAFARNFNIGQQGEAALEKLVEIAKGAASQPKSDPEAEKKLEELNSQLEQAQQQAKVAEQGAQREGQSAFQAKIDLKIAKAEMAQLKEQIKVVQREMQVNSKLGEIKVAERELSANAKTAELTQREGQVEAVEIDNAEVTEIKEGQAEIVRQIVSHGEAMAGLIETFTQAMVAPKEIIKDENGKPIGVRTPGLPDKQIIRGADGQLEGLA